MRIQDDTEAVSESQDMGSGEKPPGLTRIKRIFLLSLSLATLVIPGYYVVRSGGLFPAPLPQDSPLCQKVTQLFWVLGVFLAKTLQDARLVDLPLSPAFLKLLCGGEVSGMVRDSSDIVTRYSPELLEDVMTSSLLSTVSESDECSGEVGDRPWWLGQLDLTDLASVDPGRGGVLQKLQEVIPLKFEQVLRGIFRWPPRRQQS